MATSAQIPISSMACGRMPATVRAAVPAFHRRRRPTADELLGRKWGCKPKTAKCLRLTLGQKLADVIEVLHGLEEHQRLAEAVAPVEAALAATGNLPALEAVLVAAQVDAAEDAVAAAFLAAPSRMTASQLYGAKATEARAHDQAAEALRREFAL